MSFNDERTAIQKQLIDNFSALPIQLPNVPFTPPDNSPYIRLDILFGNGVQASIGGNPLDRYVGVIQILILVPEDTGQGTMLTYADTIATLFTRKQLESGNSGLIRTRVPSFQALGIKEGWNVGAVSVQYTRDINS